MSPGNKSRSNFKISISINISAGGSVDQELKILEMLMVIWLAYSISGITSSKKQVCCDLKMAAILKMLKY